MDSLLFHESLADELTVNVRTQLAACKAPRDIGFVNDFTLSSSGKINRRLLREQEHLKARVDG